jgi:IS30 family transposase
MTKPFPRAAREQLIELICRGASLTSASAVIGVAPSAALEWWRQAAVMELNLRAGLGGLAGRWPGDDPAVKASRRRPLTIEDRSAIAAGCFHHRSVTSIAASIGRDKSVVSREVQRHRSPDGIYRAAVAHRAAGVRRARPKPFKLVVNTHLCRRIERWMDQGWSPRLISQVLALESVLAGPGHQTVRVSHETIYRALYVQGRGSLRQDLHRQLSLKRAARKPRGTTDPRGTSIYRQAFTISQRSPTAEDRAVPGHWEGDLIIGAGGKSAIGTLVERSTRFVILLHLPTRHDAESVAEAMIREMSHLPGHLRRSIAWDRGTEMAAYRDIQIALQTPVYFCDPHSPWQRGTNENTNRLLRHWFEKGSDLAGYTQDDLRTIADTLNQRPRPTLNLQTPAVALNKLLTEAA